MEYVKHQIFAAALMDGKEIVVEQVNFIRESVDPM